MVAQGIIREAFIHHSSGENGKTFDTLVKQKKHVRSIQDFHMDGNGWSDIGYAFMVFQYVGTKNLRIEPRVFACRSTRYVPAAQLGHNSGTLPICVVGNGDAEVIAPHTKDLIASIIRKYAPHVSPSNVKGHRDVVATTCPGSKFYAGIHLIRDRVRG